MGKPFQFSMRRMFVAVTWFAVAAAMVRCLVSCGGDNPGIGLLIFFSAFAALGAGIGAIFGKALIGAMAGLACAIPALVCLMPRQY